MTLLHRRSLFFSNASFRKVKKEDGRKKRENEENATRKERFANGICCSQLSIGSHLILHEKSAIIRLFDNNSTTVCNIHSI